MRVRFEHLSPFAKVSVFYFNERWLAKFERGPIEVTLKFESSEWDEAQIKQLVVSDSLLKEVGARLDSLASLMNRVGSQ